MHTSDVCVTSFVLRSASGHSCADRCWLKPYEMKLQQRGLSCIIKISASPEISRIGQVIKYWSKNNGILKCLHKDCAKGYWNQSITKDCVSTGSEESVCNQKTLNSNISSIGQDANELCLSFENKKTLYLWFLDGSFPFLG